MNELPRNFDYDRALCCLPLAEPREDFNVKIGIHHREVQYHSPTNSTSGKNRMRAKLETQLWLPGLVRFIKIDETANI